MTDDHTHRGDDVHPVEMAMREDNGGWQPIETAPKDGNALVWVNWDDCNQGQVFVIDCAGFASGVPKPDGCSVTHWMPLPAAPTETP